MKIDVDGRELLEVTQDDIEILEYVIVSEFLEDDLKRRIKWIIEHKIERCYERFKNEWIPQLEDDPSVRTIPLNVKALFNMVKVRPDYKDRSARVAEEEARVEAEEAARAYD